MTEQGRTLRDFGLFLAKEFDGAKEGEWRCPMIGAEAAADVVEAIAALLTPDPSAPCEAEQDYARIGKAIKDYDAGRADEGQEDANQHDIGDDKRAAIYRNLSESYSMVTPPLTEAQVHHLSLFGAATVRALLNELGQLHDMASEPAPAVRQGPPPETVDTEPLPQLKNLLRANGWKPIIVSAAPGEAVAAAAAWLYEPSCGVRLGSFGRFADGVAFGSVPGMNGCFVRDWGATYWMPAILPEPPEAR